MSQPPPEPMETKAKGRDAIPMQSLFERIEQLAPQRPELSMQLRGIANEMPASATRRTLLSLGDALENNASPQQLVAKFPHHCWLLTLRSTSATTDALAAILEHSAYEQTLRKKRLRSISYPSVLFVVAITILLVACALIVPPFDEMYGDFGIRLPTLTGLLIKLSRFLLAHPILSVVIVAVVSAVFIGSLSAWVTARPRLKSRPSGSTSLRQHLAKSALQIAELCDDGLSLPHALRITAESDSSSLMRGLLGDLSVCTSHCVDELERTRSAMYFPPNFLFALRPKRSDGSRDSHPNTPMLRELSCNYRELSVSHREWTSFVLGQLSVIGVGLVIGLMVLALYMPLVSLITSLSS